MSTSTPTRAELAATLRAAATRLEHADDGAALDVDSARALAAALADVGAAGETPPTAGDAGAPPTISRVVHDVRSASGTLLAWCYLLRRGGLDEAQRAHGAAVMETAVRRMLRLIERFASVGTVAAAERRDDDGQATVGAPPGMPASPATTSAARDAARASADLRGIRILIVDDDADAREAMRMMLAAHGADVSTAVSAIDAFDVLQQGRPDVLISDIVMPDADGYALLRRVRAPDTGDRGLIPAIAVTGRGFEADRQRALAAGYQCQLTKPIAPDELIAAVHGLIGR